MRALRFIAAALAWSAIASAQLPDGGAPPMPKMRTWRGGSPRNFNPRLGDQLPPDKTLDFLSHPPAIPSARPATTPARTPPAPQAPAPTAPTPPRPAVAPPSSPAFGQPAVPPPVTAPVTATPRPHPKPRPRKPEPPPLPAPELKLTVNAPSPEAPWTIRIQNTGTIPLRIVADARLLAFDITPADAKAKARPTKCALPSDMRPSDDDDRSLVLPPGRAYVDTINPRLFCFGARDAAALVAGSSVVPRLVGSRDLPVVAPMEEVEPVVATEHEWTGAAATIGAAVVPTTTKEAAAHVRSLTLSTPAFVNVARPPEVAIAITTKNETNASVVFLLRPETIALDITGPSGVGVTDPSPTVHCAWSGPPPTPIRDLFARVAPNGTDALSVLPSVLCPEGALDHPGLYVVRAKLDTRRTSGAPLGLHTLDAEIAAETTTRLRVRETTGRPIPVAKPQLEIVPAH